MDMSLLSFLYIQVLGENMTHVEAIASLERCIRDLGTSLRTLREQMLNDDLTDERVKNLASAVVSNLEYQTELRREIIYLRSDPCL
jgi:hypothetical protein